MKNFHKNRKVPKLQMIGPFGLETLKKGPSSELIFIMHDLTVM